MQQATYEPQVVLDPMTSLSVLASGLVCMHVDRYRTRTNEKPGMRFSLITELPP